MFKVFKSAQGSNIIKDIPLEVKKVRMSGDPVSEFSETHSREERTESQAQEGQSSAPLTDAERRAKRKEEYREAASIRERALRMEREAKQKIQQTQQFSELLSQAKEDPTVFAKLLNMDPGEFQRKIFNKAYSIKEDPEPQKEETFEEQTKRRLERYEQEMSQDKERRAQEARQHLEIESQRIKHSFIQNNILPHINESHEFINSYDKYNCAGMIYDLMNSAYQEHCDKGGDESNFSLKAEDVINQMEEELEKQAEEQILGARNIGKLKKYFNESSSDDGFSVRKKDFSGRSASRTISNSFGPSAPPSVIRNSDLGGNSIQRKIPLKDRNKRLMQVQKVLGSE